MSKTSAALVYSSLVIAVAGALIHFAAIAAGPEWYAFFDAPPAVVASAREGTWLAPVSASAIGVLMLVCAGYASAALGLIGKPPLQRTVMLGIAAVCLLRALILVPLAVNHPELRSVFQVVAAFVWGMAGLGFAAGYSSLKRPQRSVHPA